MQDAAGPVVAINVSPREDLRTEWPTSYQLSGWRLLWERICRRPAALAYPSMLWALQRTVLLSSASISERLRDSVSLYLHPPVGDYEMFRWSNIREISEVGYRYGLASVLAWKERIGAAGPGTDARTAPKRATSASRHD
jgi:hypothetical protein